MKKQLAFFLFAALLASSQSAFAADYSWAYANVNYPSPAAACTGAVARSNASTTVYAYTETGLYKFSETIFRCKVLRVNMPGSYNPSNYEWNITRSGTSCPAGTTYNPDKGSCDVPFNPCTEKTGRASNISASVPLPGSACINGCSVAYHTNSNPLTTGGRTTYYYDGNYTGNQCTAANPAGYTECNLESDCTKADTAPQVETSNKCEAGPDSTTADGKPVKVYNCTETKEVKQDGDENCKWGTVQGNWTCVITQPKSTKTKTDTETKTTSNPDGSKDTQTTTTKTETKCTGVNSCTTTTTTTINNNHTNADGSPGDSSSSCKGAKCTPGSGEGEGEGEEEEGDDEIAGPSKQLVGNASEGFGEEEAEWQAKIDAGRQQLDSLINQYSTLFSGAFDLNIGTGGAKLPCYDIPIRSPYINTNLDFCPADFEDQLIYLKYILLACATILAGFIILRD